MCAVWCGAYTGCLCAGPTEPAVFSEHLAWSSHGGQLFGYPDAYATHGTWAAALLYLVMRGGWRGLV